MNLVNHISQQFSFVHIQSPKCDFFSECLSAVSAAECIIHNTILIVPVIDDSPLFDGTPVDSLLYNQVSKECQKGRFFLTPRSSPFFLHSLYQNPLLSFVYVVNTVLLKCLLKLWDISGVFNKKIYTLQLYAPDSFYELY